MSSTSGRQHELAALERAYALAADSHAIAAIVYGDDGMGKSRLLQDLLARIGTSAPVVRIRNDRFSRIVSAPLPAWPSGCIVAIDDAQFLDDAGRAQIEAGIAAGSIRFVIATTSDRAFHFAGSHELHVNLVPLEAGEIAKIVAKNAPETSERALAMLTVWAAGSPYEATVLATLGEYDVSAARAIARFVDGLPPAVRSFAQMLALIGAPIDDDFARALLADARDLRATLETLRLLVTRDRDGIAFAHALGESAVIETIAMKIPLHRRIVAALDRRELRSLRDRAIVLEQLLGAGDRERAKERALELAFEAQRTGALAAQVWASERHVELGEPPDERFVRFYTQYIQALLSAGSFERAEAVASHAFNAAQRGDLPDAVALGALLIEAQWRFERKEAAHATYDRLCAAFPNAQSLAELQRAAPWMHAS